MDSEYLKKMIMADEKTNLLFNRVMEKNKIIWKRFEGPDEILKWLTNFEVKDIYLALTLAYNVLYITQDELRSSWKGLVTNRLKQLICDEKFSTQTAPERDTSFLNYLNKKCIFVGFGDDGSSGTAMIYELRKSLSPRTRKNLEFVSLFRLLHSKVIDFSKIEKIILIDDFIGSGNQAKETWEKDYEGKSLKMLKEKNPQLDFIYLAPVGCLQGQEFINNTLKINVIVYSPLDKRFQCFSKISNIYTDPEERKKAKNIMESKGKSLNSSPLGFGNLALAVVFAHNTPNDSLPVIWAHKEDGSWYPLFERF